MRESRADTRTALLQALALHVVLFVLLFAGLQWSRPSPSVATRGEVIEADLVDAGDLSASMQRALQRTPKPPPPPVPEPLPEPIEEAPPPDAPDTLPPPVPEPAPVEQEAVQRDGQAPEPAEQPREQETTRKQPKQAELDAQPTPEPDRLDQRIAAIRKRIEQARKARELAEQRQLQLADARASASSSASSSKPPPPGNPDSLSMETASYGVAITQAVERQWIRPDSIRSGQRCQVLIVQVPGGEVVDVQVSPGCPFDDLGKRSLEAAILKASPLPYAGFEAVFQRRLVLWFEPSSE